MARQLFRRIPRQTLALGVLTALVAAAAFSASTSSGPSVAVVSPPFSEFHGLSSNRTEIAPVATPDCGIESGYPPVPAGFDPTQATAVQLQTYGFPPRPAGDLSTPAVASWTAVMNAAKVEDRPQQTCGTGTHESWRYSGFWAGHAVSNSDYYNDAFTYSQSIWVQPSVPGNSNYSNYQCAPDASFWVGTSGAGHIIQAGADSIAVSSPVYKFWVEDYPNNTVWEGTPTLSAGNKVFVTEQYIGNQQASFYLENETTGHFVPIDLSAPYNGDVEADFINERGLCASDSYLPNFGSVATSSNAFGDNTGDTFTLSENQNHRVVMTSDCVQGGTVLSEPGSVNADGKGNGDFTHYWYAARPYANC
jgi:peptidase A4-like protein